MILLSCLYKSTQTKLKAYEEKNRELTALLCRRTVKFKSLVKKTDLLVQKFEENEQQLELHKSELKEQQVALAEMQMLLPRNHLLPFVNILVGGLDRDSSSRPLWVFRKHQRNLVVVTRPYIGRIIKAAIEAGLVSKHVGKCAKNCTTMDHDCADRFYKALLKKVSESPEALKEFLQLLQQTLRESQPCCQLCSKILVEVCS